MPQQIVSEVAVDRWNGKGSTAHRRYERRDATVPPVDEKRSLVEFDSGPDRPAESHIAKKIGSGGFEGRPRVACHIAKSVALQGSNGRPKILCRHEHIDVGGGAQCGIG